MSYRNDEQSKRLSSEGVIVKDFMKITNVDFRNNRLVIILIRWQNYLKKTREGILLL